MALTIYRRHGKKCPYYRKSRYARNNHACKAQCAIWVQGTLGGESIRRSLDLTRWEAASALVRAWEVEGHIGRAILSDAPRAVSRPVEIASAPPLIDGSRTTTA